MFLARNLLLGLVSGDLVRLGRRVAPPEQRFTKEFSPFLTPLLVPSVSCPTTSEPANNLSEESGKTTGSLADKLPVEDQRQQDLKSNLLFQSDLLRLLNSLSGLEHAPVQTDPEQEPTKPGLATRI